MRELSCCYLNILITEMLRLGKCNIRSIHLLPCGEDIHSKGLDDHQPIFQNGDSVLVTITRTGLQQCAFDGT